MLWPVGTYNERMDEDYYKTLGVSRNASAADIQKAYRELARKYHPDLNPDDKTAKTKFQQVQTAFDVLNDSKKREMYDRYGSSFESMGAGGPQGGPGGGPAGFEDVDFSQFFGDKFQQDPSGGFGDIFSQFRRGGRGRRPRPQPPRGVDLRYPLEIPFQTAVSGGEVQVTVRRGTGKVETIAVKIPAGMGDGKKIRLRGQGEAQAAGGPRGDIIIEVKVTPHRYFRRRGNHLDVVVPLTLAEAALGAKIDLPTPQGTIALSVPKGTSSGAKLRVKGHGVAPLKGEPGDLFAEIQIVLPADLDEQSIELIHQFERHNEQTPRSDLSW
jgi:DnaJ-class molecular chaperone